MKMTNDVCACQVGNIPVYSLNFYKYHKNIEIRCLKREERKKGKVITNRNFNIKRIESIRTSLFLKIVLNVKPLLYIIPLATYM